MWMCKILNHLRISEVKWCQSQSLQCSWEGSWPFIVLLVLNFWGTRLGHRGAAVSLHESVQRGRCTVSTSISRRHPGTRSLPRRRTLAGRTAWWTAGATSAVYLSNIHRQTSSSSSLSSSSSSRPVKAAILKVPRPQDLSKLSSSHHQHHF